VLELHGRPRGVELLEDLLHTHLLDSLVHNVLHFILVLVQIQRQQVGQGRLVIYVNFTCTRAKARRINDAIA